MTTNIATPNQAWAEESNKFLRSPQWKLIKQLTYKHFDKVCTNCGSHDSIHLDHVVARVNDPKGSMWLDINNLQPLCEYCNSTVKGRKNTDYRSIEHKAKCATLTLVFENTLVRKGFEPNWKMWDGKKSTKQKTPEKKRQLGWKSKISRMCKNKTITYDEVLKNLNVGEYHQDFDYIHNYVSMYLSKGQQAIRERKRKKVNNTKTTKRKVQLLDNLHNNCRKMKRHELIAKIEEIARIQL